MDLPEREWGTRLSDFQVGGARGAKVTTRSRRSATRKPTKYRTLSQARNWDNQARHFSDLILGDEILSGGNSDLSISILRNSNDDEEADQDGGPSSKHFSDEFNGWNDQNSQDPRDASAGNLEELEEVLVGSLTLTRELFETYMDRLNDVGEVPSIQGRKCHLNARKKLQSLT